MVEKTNAVNVSGTSEFNSTARFRVENNLIRHRLSTLFFDRKNYAVETKQAKNSSFDGVGSQQILETFDRKEAVKRVKRNLVPCRSALSVLLA